MISGLLTQSFSNASDSKQASYCNTVPFLHRQIHKKRNTDHPKSSMAIAPLSVPHGVQYNIVQKEYMRIQALDNALSMNRHVAAFGASRKSPKKQRRHHKFQGPKSFCERICICILCNSDPECIVLVTWMGLIIYQSMFLQKIPLE